jgi:pilus assembly protein CpaE
MAMSDSIRIYATGACEGFSSLLETLEARDDLELVGVKEQVADATEELTRGPLDVVLHAMADSAFPAADIELIGQCTKVPILLVGSGDCSAILTQALAAGVADLLELPKDNAVFAIQKAALQSKLAPEEQHQGKMVTVFCPKGGVGKTTLAVNLAAALATAHDKRTLILDLDLQFGDAAFMVGLHPEKTIYDLMLAPGELDTDKLAGWVTHLTSTLDLLPAPLQPEQAELVTEQKLARLIEVARDSYDYIVVDTSPFFHGPLLAAFDRSDELLLVCGIDALTTKNTALGLHTLDLLSFPKNRISLVLNRANTKAALTRREIEGALGVPIRFEVPADSAVLDYVNRSKPVYLGNPQASFSKALSQIAGQLVGAAQEPKKRSGRLSLRARAA